MSEIEEAARAKGDQISLLARVIEAFTDGLGDKEAVISVAMAVGAWIVQAPISGTPGDDEIVAVMFDDIMRNSIRIYREDASP